MSQFKEDHCIFFLEEQTVVSGFGIWQYIISAEQFIDRPADIYWVPAICKLLRQKHVPAAAAATFPVSQLVDA